jgi:hypothetical protein
MNKQLLAVLIVLLLTTKSLGVGPVVQGPTAYVTSSGIGATATMAITVTCGDAVKGIDFYVQSGNGGAENGFPSDTAPIITGVDIIGPGTLFNASNTGANLQSLGSRMWYSSTTTDVNVAPTLSATGTLAKVTIDATGAAGGVYPLHLKGVAASIYQPNGVDTEFPLVTTTVNDGRIAVLHAMTWNKGDAGNWTETQWLGAPPFAPFYPDDSADVVIGTPYAVTVSAAQLAHSVGTSTGGQLLINGGSLNVTKDITGTGKTTLQNGATLTANHIFQDTLELSGGCIVTLRPIGSGAGAGSMEAGSPMHPVPEPGVIMLLSIACLCVLLLRSFGFFAFGRCRRY